MEENTKNRGSKLESKVVRWGKNHWQHLQEWPEVEVAAVAVVVVVDILEENVTALFRLHQAVKIT